MLRGAGGEGGGVNMRGWGLGNKQKVMNSGLEFRVQGPHAPFFLIRNPITRYTKNSLQSNPKP